ncbi:MAG TPA: TatD family hydrolase [Candidatus Paceibacterota bacterium]|nr:TatD family hydrolase [Candidatus Paceibacterota bacterium]
MTPKYIDIHCHVNFKAFDEDRDAVISRALDNDTWLINVGTQIDTSLKAVEIANKYNEGVYAIVGLHPIHTDASYHDEKELGEGGKEFTSRGEVFDKNVYKELLKNPKVVGIGECGLDYYRLDEDSIEKQKKMFIEQIELANEFNKPLMLHVRNNSPLSPSDSSPSQGSKNAYFDVYELLKKHSKVHPAKGLARGVSHFFAGSVEDMKRFIEIGIYISFAGPITYKPKPEICDYEKVIKNTPLDMILTDTDSPYVAPVPHRGKRNEPAYVMEVVKKIAEIKGLKEEDVASAVVKNAKRLFDI